MFKKTDNIELDLESVIRIFDISAQQEVFNQDLTHKTWIWAKLQFIVDFFKHNNLEKITVEQLSELIYSEKHKRFFTEENHEFTKNNAKSLDFIVEENPITKTLSNVLVANLSTVLLAKKESKKLEHFSKGHLLSILNICGVTFILMTGFYSWKLFGIWGLGILAGLLFGYKLSKNLSVRLINHRAQKDIAEKVQKNKISPNEELMKMINDLGLEPWTPDREINDELIKFKNKTIHFFSIYLKNEKNRHPSMILDVEKMWRQHIPLFIDKAHTNPETKETTIKTLHSMGNVLQKHIENLFWDDGLEISAKHRYWLAKETEKNI